MAAARLLSTLPALFGLLGAGQAVSWATMLGVVALIVSLGLTRPGRTKRRRVAGITLDGTNIESLHTASVLRRVNHTLVIEEAENTAIISGRDIVISWRCDGYCRADRETAMEFSIDSDNDIPFEQMACFAYDLLRDPKQTHRLQPVLVGPDGLSKKIAVSFLEPLKTRQPFSVLLTWSSPNCMKNNPDYYTTTFSFDQGQVPRCVTRLIFLKERPTWVRLHAKNVGGLQDRKRVIPYARTRRRHRVSGRRHRRSGEVGAGLLIRASCAGRVR